MPELEYHTVRSAGEPIWLEDGHFDRPALAGVIFSDDKKRELLNEVVHPAVKEYVLNAVKDLLFLPL